MQILQLYHITLKGKILYYRLEDHTVHGVLKNQGLIAFFLYITFSIHLIHKSVIRDYEKVGVIIEWNVGRGHWLSSLFAGR